MAGIDSSRGGSGAIAEIKVTPLVDVMLVLLVIFMVTAPIIQQGVAVDLPKTRAAPLNAQEEPLVVGIAQNGAIYLNDVPIAIGDLRGKLVAIAQAKPDHQVLLRADRNVPYGEVVRVIAAGEEAGGSRRGMVAGETTRGRGSLAGPPPPG